MPKIKCTTNFENETITMKTKEFDRFIGKVKKEIKKKIRTQTAKEFLKDIDEGTDILHTYPCLIRKLKKKYKVK